MWWQSLLVTIALVAVATLITWFNAWALVVSLAVFLGLWAIIYTTFFAD